MLLLEVQVFLVERVDTINHGLNQLNFGVAETMLVGNVVGDSSLTARLTTGASGLQVEGLTSGLQGRQSLLGPSWQVNVHRSTHSSSQVGGAGVEVAVLGMEHEVLARFGISGVLNAFDSPSQALKHTLKINDIATFR